MMRDERGLPLSTDSAEAAALFDRAVEHYLKFHADTPALVGRMLAADPNFVLGHCFKGYLLLSASNPAFASEIAATLAAARPAPTATERERQHVAAFAAWARRRARPRLRDLAPDPRRTPDRSAGGAHLRHDLVPPRPDRENPRAGRPARTALVARIAGYQLFRTIWAFAHEEAGDTRGAERAVDEAIDQDPTNYFAQHVKAHVLEMECRPREGRDWLANGPATGRAATS